MPSQYTYKRERMFLDAIREAYPYFSDEDMNVFEIVFDLITDKSPSRQKGGNGVTDDFYEVAARILCGGLWCENVVCRKHSYHSLFNCADKIRPSKCGVWKKWRQNRKSWPECSECLYYRSGWESGYQCSCRKKIKPKGCPK